MASISGAVGDIGGPDLTVHHHAAQSCEIGHSDTVPALWATSAPLLRQRRAKRKIGARPAIGATARSRSADAAGGIRVAGPDRLLYDLPPEATWRSGYATVCKTVYTGSIPVVASNSLHRARNHESRNSEPSKALPCIRRRLCYSRAAFPGSSVVEQPAVNRLVAGSNPARGAKFFKDLAKALRGCFRLKVRRRHEDIKTRRQSVGDDSTFSQAVHRLRQGHKFADRLLAILPGVPRASCPDWPGIWTDTY